MKLKAGLLLREIAGENVVMSMGTQTDFKGLITLNETACVLWKRLEQGAEVEDLTAALLAEYEVDEKTASEHAAAFANKMKELDLLD